MTMPLFSHAGAGWSPASGPTGLASPQPFIAPAPPAHTAPSSPLSPAPAGGPLYTGSSPDDLVAWLGEHCPSGDVLVGLRGGEEDELCRWECSERAVSVHRPGGLVTALAMRQGSWAATGGLNPTVSAVRAPLREEAGGDAAADSK